MTQYPQTSPAKCFKAIESTIFSDDAFDASIQTLGDSIASTYVPSIQYIFNMPFHGVFGFGDLFICLRSHTYKPISTRVFPEFS